MTRTFIQTDEFVKRWEALGLTDADLRRLELEIMKNPQTGVVVQREENGMSDVYESIITGLSEAIEDAKSAEPKLKRRMVTIMPVKEYRAEEIKEIRKNTGLSQKLFAGYMGVSDKTVEAWESGKNRPSGAASRLLNMMEMDADLTVEFPFVKVSG